VAIRIVLVDDHAVVRDGVARLLEAQPDLRVVASFSDGREAIRYVEREEPEIAVVDIAMPGMNGIEVARRICDASPATAVLALSMHANPEYACQALRAGVRGYVAKEVAGRVLVEAVRAVHAGRRYISAPLDRKEIELRLREDAPEALDGLSAREREVLQLTVEGHSITETAMQLRLSPKSVETYRSRLMAKLGIEDLPALVKFAIRHGITSAD
jgi:DNA-binding NarL/FixJ family response regulator